MIEAALGRLAAMKGDLLPREVYARMLSAPSEGEARDVLRGTAYAAALGRAGDGARPADLERELWADLLSAWARIVKFLEGGPADCARRLAGRFEIENLKRTVRRVLANVSPGDAPPLWDLAGLAGTDAEELRRARSVAEVNRLASRTPYARAFERAANRLVEGETLFGFEQTLAVEYRETVARAAGAMWGGRGREARTYVARRQHYDNLRWALRFRFMRGMTAEETRQYLLRPTRPAEGDEIEGVLASEGLADAVGLISPLLEEERPTAARPREVDRALRRAAARWAAGRLRSAFMQFESLLAYFDVRSQEVRDVSVILTGKRQGRSAGEIGPHLGLAA